MTRYVFIESRDPFESRDARFVVETATALKRRGDEVTVFLVQNEVLAARRDARADLADARLAVREAVREQVGLYSTLTGAVPHDTPRRAGVPANEALPSRDPELAKVLQLPRKRA